MEYKKLNIFIYENSSIINIDELANKPELCKEIQLILVELGLLNTADGVYGIKTKHAFSEFKRINYQSDSEYLGVHTAKLLLCSVNQEQENISDHTKELPLIPRIERAIPEKIDWEDLECPISKYFVVADVTLRESNRIPSNVTVVRKVLALAKNLDAIQDSLDKGTIVVKSWLRPPVPNKAVNGNENSPHLFGSAVDISCYGKDSIEFQKFVNNRWYGGLGFGARQNMVHLDMRNGKGWWSSQNLIQGEKGTRWTHSH